MNAILVSSSKQFEKDAIENMCPDLYSVKKKEQYSPERIARDRKEFIKEYLP